VAGGIVNHALGQRATVSGGSYNAASGYAAAIGGGQNNNATATDATVSGGSSNNAAGSYSAIPGGIGNTATNYAFAAGYGAQATNQGAFVWSSQVVTVSTNAYSFTARSPGGVRFFTSTNNVGAFLAPNATAWSVLSDRNSKENFQPIDERGILHQLEQMPVTAWSYKHDPTRRYIGPTAQDFKAAFGLGTDDRSINTLDEAGVTLAAVKGVGQEVDQLKSQLSQRDQQISSLRSQMSLRDAKIESLEKKMNEFSERLNLLPPAPSQK